MRRALMAASAIAMLAGAQAFGQTVGVGPAETIIIEPEQRTLIREYVVKERVAPVTLKERISVGATLPAVRYGTLKTWANELGLGDAVGLLDQTLAEEKKTDATLTEIAESIVNREAEAA